MNSLKVSRLAAALLALALMAGAYGCSSGSDSTDFITLPGGLWAYGDTLAFHPATVVADTADTPRTGRLRLAVMHSNSYPYSNLWVELTVPAGPGRVFRDTVQMELADAYGHWQGSGMGASYQREITLPRTVALRPSDSVTVRHIMRVDTLRHLRCVGLRFTSH